VRKQRKIDARAGCQAAICSNFVHSTPSSNVYKQACAGSLPTSRCDSPASKNRRALKTMRSYADREQGRSLGQHALIVASWPLVWNRLVLGGWAGNASGPLLEIEQIEPGKSYLPSRTGRAVCRQAIPR
jgi:hypothetical protein